jgi:transketolase
MVRRLMARATGDERHGQSSTSTLDVLWVLYNRVLRVDAARPDWDGRDRFILSKGHGPAGYYAVLAAEGFFPSEWLDRFLDFDGALGSHPDRTLVPGVEASTGSLGHGIALGAGVALALSAKGLSEQRVVVLCGDGELNEGSCWEAILLVPRLGIANLTLVIVDNHSSAIGLSPLDEKLAAFGWSVRVVDGHDHDALARALCEERACGPRAVVADIPEGEW